MAHRMHDARLDWTTHSFHSMPAVNITPSKSPPPAKAQPTKRLSTPFPLARTHPSGVLEPGAVHHSKESKSNRSSLDVAGLSPSMMRRRLASRSLLELSASTETISDVLQKPGVQLDPRSLVKSRRSLTPLDNCVLYVDPSMELATSAPLERCTSVTLADDRERISSFDPLPNPASLRKKSSQLDVAPALKTWAVLAPIAPRNSLGPDDAVPGHRRSLSDSHSHSQSHSAVDSPQSDGGCSQLTVEDVSSSSSSSSQGSP